MIFKNMTLPQIGTGDTFYLSASSTFSLNTFAHFNLFRKATQIIDILPLSGKMNPKIIPRKGKHVHGKKLYLNAYYLYFSN